MPKHNTDNGPLIDLNLHNIDRVIVGGESGPKARPMKKEWALDIKDQIFLISSMLFTNEFVCIKKYKTLMRYGEFYPIGFCYLCAKSNYHGCYSCFIK